MRKDVPSYDLQDLGGMLIALRQASGMSHRAFADALGVAEAELVRHERDRYAGLTVKSAHHLLAALEKLQERATQVSGTLSH